MKQDSGWRLSNCIWGTLFLVFLALGWCSGIGITRADIDPGMTVEQRNAEEILNNGRLTEEEASGATEEYREFDPYEGQEQSNHAEKPPAGSEPTATAALFGATPVTAMAAGSSHSVVLKEDGTIWTWGSNNYGQLGNWSAAFEEYQSTPQQVYYYHRNNYAAKAVAAGDNTSFFLLGDGSVWAWGYNPMTDLLGVGDTDDFEVTHPMEVKGLYNVKQIAAGNDFVVALTKWGTVYTWGQNWDGELGTGAEWYEEATTPCLIPGLYDVAAISACGRHGMALKSDGTVWAWGNNTYGQIGDGTEGLSADRFSPVQVTGLPKIIAIAAGQYHSLALAEDGSIYSWGSNGFGQLGDGSTADRSLPALGPALNGVKAIAAGRDFSQALGSDGRVWCWGANSSGQLGNGGTGSSRTPVRVQSLTDVKDVCAGNSHSLALRNDGSVWAWGYNSRGQLGDGVSVIRTLPGPAPDLSIQQADWGWRDTPPAGSISSSGIKQTAQGSSHTLILKEDGTVWAKGWNYYGQLGVTTAAPRGRVLQDWVAVPLSDVKAVAAYYDSSAAIKNDGTVWTWGSNQSGYLGYGPAGDYDDYQIQPGQVPGLQDVAAFAIGSMNKVVKNDGTVWEWGGTTSGLADPPAQVEGLTDIKVAGDEIALKKDGTVWVWGYNQWGELGQGTYDNHAHNDPIMVPGLPEIKAIAEGNLHRLALDGNGKIWAWGYNGQGQIGIGTSSYYDYCCSPVQVEGLDNVAGIAAGYIYSAAMKLDGSVYTWGGNQNGALKNGEQTYRNTPVRSLVVSNEWLLPLFYYFNESKQLVLLANPFAGATRYDFYRDGELLKSQNSSVYVDASVAPGEKHTYYAHCFDSTGEDMGQTPPVSLTIPKIVNFSAVEILPEAGRESASRLGETAYRYYRLLDESGQLVTGARITLPGSVAVTSYDNGIFRVPFVTSDRVNSPGSVEINQSLYVDMGFIQGPVHLPPFTLRVEPRQHTLSYQITPELEGQISLGKAVTGGELNLDFIRDQERETNKYSVGRQVSFGGGVNVSVGASIELPFGEATAEIGAESLIKALKGDKYEFNNPTDTGEKLRLLALLLDSIGDSPIGKTTSFTEELIKVFGGSAQLNPFTPYLTEKNLGLKGEVNSTAELGAEAGIKNVPGLDQFTLELGSEAGASLEGERNYTQYVKDSEYARLISTRFSGSTTWDLAKASFGTLTGNANELEATLGVSNILSGNTEVSLQIDEFKPLPGKQAKVEVSIGYVKNGITTDRTGVTNKFTLYKTDKLDPVASIIGGRNLDGLPGVSQAIARFAVILLKCPDTYYYEETIDNYDTGVVFQLGANLKLAELALGLGGDINAETHRQFVKSSGVYSLSGLTKIPLSEGVDDWYVQETRSMPELFTNEIINPIIEEAINAVGESLKNSGQYIEQSFKSGCAATAQTAGAAVNGIGQGADKLVTVIKNKLSGSNASGQSIQAQAAEPLEVVLSDSSFIVSIADEASGDEVDNLQDPFTLQLNCSQDMLTEAGLSGTDTPEIKICRFNQDNKYWEGVDTAFDSAGMVFSAPITHGGIYALLFDKAAPTLAEISPPAGSNTPASFTLQARIIDLSGVDSANSRVVLDNATIISGTDWDSHYNTKTGILSYDLAGLAEGEHQLAFILQDRPGHNREYGQVLQTDATPPQITIASPGAGLTTNLNTLIVSGTTEPGAIVTVGGQEAQVNASGEFSSQVALLPGDNIITATARDQAGNMGQASCTVSVVPTNLTFDNQKVEIQKGQTGELQIQSTQPVDGHLYMFGRFSSDLIDRLELKPGSAGANPNLQVNARDGSFTLDAEISGQGQLLSLLVGGGSSGSGSIKAVELSITQADGSKLAVDNQLECTVNISGYDGIYGTVSYLGSPVSGALVQVGSVQTSTDNSGKYLFKNLLSENSSFDLTVAKEGLATKTLNNLTYLTGTVTSYDIAMEKDSALDAPLVVGTSPTRGGYASLPLNSIGIDFDQDIVLGSASGQISVVDEQAKLISTSVTTSGRTLQISPQEELSLNTVYVVYIPPNGVVNNNGNGLASAETFSFTTASGMYAISPSPGSVHEADNFSQDLTMNLLGASFAESIKPSQIMLGDDFSNLSTGSIIRTSPNTIIVHISGSLSKNSGHGTITLAPEASSVSKSITADVAVQPASSTSCGDVNKDNYVDGFDALDILLYEAQLLDQVSVEATQTIQNTPEMADVNGDGLVNGFDALDILFYEAQLYDQMNASAKLGLGIYY